MGMEQGFKKPKATKTLTELVSELSKKRAKDKNLLYFYVLIVNM